MKTVKVVKRVANCCEEKERRYTRAPTGVKTTLTHELLGFIAERPEISGYDIMKVFELSMSYYWHALPGQIYPTLEHMVQTGLVTKRDVIQTDRPNKRLFTITLAGERKMLNWLQSPFAELQLTHPPRLRFRFLGNPWPDGARGPFEEGRPGTGRRPGGCAAARVASARAASAWCGGGRERCPPARHSSRAGRPIRRRLMPLPAIPPEG